MGGLERQRVVTVLAGIIAAHHTLSVNAALLSTYPNACVVWYCLLRFNTLAAIGLLTYLLFFFVAKGGRPPDGQRSRPAYQSAACARFSALALSSRRARSRMVARAPPSPRRSQRFEGGFDLVVYHFFSFLIAKIRVVHFTR